MTALTFMQEDITEQAQTIPSQYHTTPCPTLPYHHSTEVIHNKRSTNQMPQLTGISKFLGAISPAFRK